MSPAFGLSLAGAIPLSGPTRSASGCVPFRAASAGTRADPWTNPGRIKAPALATGLHHHRLDGGAFGTSTGPTLPLPDHALDVAPTPAPDRAALEAATPHLWPAGATRGTKKRVLLSGIYDEPRLPACCWPQTKLSYAGFRHCAIAGRPGGNRLWCRLLVATINASLRSPSTCAPAAASSGWPVINGKRTSRLSWASCVSTRRCPQIS